MPKVFLNGTQLNYVRTGEGMDTVLIHGLASNLAFWYSGVMLALRSQYRMTAYDLRGHGNSGMPPSGYTHSEMADDLLHLIDHLKLGQFHLVGHSYGALISLSFALRHPERLRSITLADAPIGGDQGISEHSNLPMWWHSFRKKIRESGISIEKNEPYPELVVLEGLAHSRVREVARPLVPRSTFMPFGWGKGSPRTAARWLEMLTKTTARQDIRQRSISFEDLGNIAVPTLAVYGQKSKYVQSAEILRQSMRKVRVHYVQNAGHFHPWERPADFIEIWQRFICEIESRHRFSGKERRKHDRFEVIFPLTLYGAREKKFAAKSVDVSKQGLLVSSLLELEIGAKVQLFAKEGGKDERIFLTGRVVRRSRNENTAEQMFGIELVEEQESKAWESFIRSGLAGKSLPQNNSIQLVGK
jgi:pimeloyl-ACP methyl ester carboxylesterase